MAVVLGQLKMASNGLDQALPDLLTLSVASDRVSFSGRGVMPPTLAALAALLVLDDLVLLHVPEKIAVARPTVHRSAILRQPA